MSALRWTPHTTQKKRNVNDTLWTEHFWMNRVDHFESSYQCGLTKNQIDRFRDTDKISIQPSITIRRLQHSATLHGGELGAVYDG